MRKIKCAKPCDQSEVQPMFTVSLVIEVSEECDPEIDVKEELQHVPLTNFSCTHCGAPVEEKKE